MNRDCLLYARYSTDRQNPKSCDDQLREADRYASAQGWRVVGRYQDAGVSGTKSRAERAGWDQMLAFIERGGLRRGGVVLTWDLDRWSRDWADGMIEALRLHQLGVALADTLDGVIDQSDMGGKLRLTLKVAGADDYIRKLRRGVKRGLASRREAGYWTWPPPIGYANRKTPLGTVLEPVPSEVALVERIYLELDAGRTPAAVARGLNFDRLTTKRGGPWSPSAVRAVAAAVTYLGQIGLYDSRAGGVRRPTRSIPKEQVRIIPGLHPAVIPRDLWERVQIRMRQVPRGPNATAVRPLSGLVVCGECGSICHITGGAWPWQAYACRWRRGETGRCTSDRRIEIPRLEEAVRAWLRGVTADPGVVERAALRVAQAGFEARQRAARDAAPLEREIRELEHRQERLLESLYAGAAPALINERLGQVQAQLEAALKRLRSQAPAVRMVDPAALERALRTILESADLDLVAVRGVVESITLPADCGAPPVLRAFGVDFPLAVDGTRRRRGVAKAMWQAGLPRSHKSR